MKTHNPIDGLVVCVGCGLEKPSTEYYKEPRKLNGLSSRCKECYQVWKKEHPLNIKVAQVRWRERHGRNYYAKNRETLRSNVIRFHSRHPEKRLQYNRKYQSANLDKKVVKEARRRARLAAVVNDLTVEQWQERLTKFNGYCAYCLKPIDKPVMEHMKPIAKGGAHTISNVIPSCVHCNSRKGDKNLLEFLLYQSQVESRMPQAA